MNNEEIIYQKITGNGGDVVELILNRPAQLNVLNQPMCQQLYAYLEECERDDNIKAIVIRGAGDRAFCAGGDIRFIYANGPDQIAPSAKFFYHEYRLNAKLFHFKKPCVAFWDGIVMGGGAGVSVHGSHRVATEKTLFAMPEVSIGFFSDVGTGYVLPRCPGKLGWYIGLTGNFFKADDVCYAQLATHKIPQVKIAEVIDTLVASDFSAHELQAVTKILDNFSVAVEVSQLQENRQKIDDFFSLDSVAKIMHILEKQNDPWCDETLMTLKQRCPLSLRVMFIQFKKGAGLDFNQQINIEYNLVRQFLQTPDFYEGIRAAIIDKDRQPKWSVADVSEIMDAQVQAFFADRGDDLQLN